MKPRILLINPNSLDSVIYQTWNDTDKTIQDVVETYRHDLWEQGYDPEAKFRNDLTDTFILYRTT